MAAPAITLDVAARPVAPGVEEPLAAPAGDPFGLDPEFRRTVLPAARFLHERYWRVEVSGAELVPVSVVGAEEIYPLVGRAEGVGRALGMPYVPVTPFFPLLGMLGALPLPTKWFIHFGKPIRLVPTEGEARWQRARHEALRVRR